MTIAEKPQTPSKPVRRGDETMEKFAKKALEAFKADMPDAFAEMVRQYEGKSVAAGVFGLGMAVVGVKHGEVHINPTGKDLPVLVGRGATYLETISDLAAGKVTILEAYHRGDIAVQSARSETLHDGYNRLLKYSDAGLKSEKLHHVFQEFCRAVDLKT